MEVVPPSFTNKVVLSETRLPATRTSSEVMSLTLEHVITTMMSSPHTHHTLATAAAAPPQGRRHLPTGAKTVKLCKTAKGHNEPRLFARGARRPCCMVKMLMKLVQVGRVVSKVWPKFGLHQAAITRT
ncbi:hypothetical protein J6590_057926 [Homalodisca vitripennis]|nr:hypothetical protein J6590_057926 [Homalodisca vitripennis]